MQDRASAGGEGAQLDGDTGDVLIEVGLGDGHGIWRGGGFGSEWRL